MGKGRRDDQRGRATVRGFGTLPPGEDESDTIVDCVPGQAAPEGASSAWLQGRRSRVEIDYVEEEGTPSLLQGPWRAFEVWTRNRIYVLDGSMTCLEVIDRASGRADPDNPVVGSRLFGGQLRTEEGAIREVSHPLPSRGAAAVFGHPMGKRYSLSETSPVTRVVMRMRLVLVGPEASPPSWDDITGEHSAPPDD